MKKTFINSFAITFSAVIVTALSLVACNANDGVPAQSDVHHPVNADGKSVATDVFLETYCQGKTTNATCISVAQAGRADASHKGLPKGW